LFVPSTLDTEEASTALQSSLPTVTGDSAESGFPNIPVDVYEWCNDDLKRSAKDRASRVNYHSQEKSLNALLTGPCSGLHQVSSILGRLAKMAQ